MRTAPATNRHCCDTKREDKGELPASSMPTGFGPHPPRPREGYWVPLHLCFFGTLYPLLYQDRIHAPTEDNLTLTLSFTY